MNGAFQRLQRNSYLSGGNASYMEALYEAYLSDPNSVDTEWKRYFQGLEAGDGAAARDVPHSPIRQQFAELGRHRARVNGAVAEMTPDLAQKQAAVLRLINGYRFRGHQRADIDPLHLREKPEVPDLDPAYHGLADSDMDQTFTLLERPAAHRIGARRLRQAKIGHSRLLSGIRARTAGTEPRSRAACARRGRS